MHVFGTIFSHFGYHRFTGPAQCQHFDVEFQFSSVGRRFSTFHKYRELPNGSQIERDWLVYSPSKEAIFCFVCRLFGSNINDADNFNKMGFNDWKNSGRSIQCHEHSKQHQEHYLTFRRIAKQAGSIESSLLSGLEIEMDYWRRILNRIVSVVKFLGSRGLSFRGSNQRIGSNQNGNYLGTLELLSEYDPLLSTHISQYGNKGRGRASYLSANICDEFTFLIAQRIEKQILTELKDAKYYALSVDSTPDVSHTDQMAICLRYVKSGKPVERFICFTPIEDHTANHMAETIFKIFDDKSINIMDCRGQSYDNANMAGCYNGLQAKITNVNKFATFVPCAAHSLQLVGKNAAASISRVTAFFDTIESLYSFFVHSSFRWNKLKSTLTGPVEFVLKRATGKHLSLIYLYDYFILDMYTQLNPYLTNTHRN